MTFSKLLAVGAHVPERILTNHDLEKLVETSDAWIRERTGIETRHIVSEGETTVDLATRAAEKALASAQMSATTLDMIIVATCTPDKYFPSTACLVQANLNAGKGIAFDVAAACAGFNYALSIADQYIKSGMVKTVMVIGAETMSKLLDWSDRSTCVLFGDGAGAVILTASETPGILSTHIEADGTQQDLLYVDNPAVSQAQDCFIKMRGNELFRVAVKTLGDVVEHTLAHHKFTGQDIDWLIPHQANYRIIQAVAKRLGMPMDKVMLTLAEHGNTSSASIPIALEKGIASGQIKPGDLLLLESFGGGLTWGSALIQY